MDSEILNSLKYVRPGNGYQPKFPIFSKVDVNGELCHPVWQFLRDALPAPVDNKNSLMGDPKLIIWKPVTRFVAH